MTAQISSQKREPILYQKHLKKAHSSDKSCLGSGIEGRKDGPACPSLAHQSCPPSLYTRPDAPPPSCMAPSICSPLRTHQQANISHLLFSTPRPTTTAPFSAIDASETPDHTQHRKICYARIPRTHPRLPHWLRARTIYVALVPPPWRLISAERSHVLCSGPGHLVAHVPGSHSSHSALWCVC
jgi:hypothetical protein